jgi:hypothetical protein
MRALLLACGLLLSAPVFALYDPAPDAMLVQMQGEWQGTLTYSDYSEAGKRVTLPTTLYVAPASPDSLTLHYVFDDGPGKTVYSYEHMRFDPARNEVTWRSGINETSETRSRIVSSVQDGDVRRLVFERVEEGDTLRYTLETGPDVLVLQKDEVGADGVAQFRNRYEFKRDRP